MVYDENFTWCMMKYSHIHSQYLTPPNSCHITPTWALSTHWVTKSSYCCPNVLGCGATHWSVGILSMATFSEKNDFLSSETFQARGFTKWVGLEHHLPHLPWKFCCLVQVTLWIHKGYCCILSRRQNFTAFPHILWFLHSFCLRVPLTLFRDELGFSFVFCHLGLYDFLGRWTASLNPTTKSGTLASTQDRDSLHCLNRGWYM